MRDVVSAEEFGGLGDAGAVDAEGKHLKLSLPLSLAWSRSSEGISTLQGAHQVAHKLRSTTLPRHSERRCGLPSAPVKERSGTAWDAAGLDEGAQGRSAGAAASCSTAAWPMPRIPGPIPGHKARR